MVRRGVECTPVCPFRAFECLKNALIYRRRGRRVIAFCTWTGDECIGPKCQFASCKRHALLPDGTCRLKLERVQPKKEQSFSIEEEALREEQLYGKLRSKLKKLGAEFDKLE